MKRRFQVTLLAVAIAVVGSMASAMAPVIGTIPDVVIADDEAVTGSNLFVYPDALDADSLANDTDETVTSDGIIWSYYSATGNYQINGQDSLDPSNVANDPNAPTTAQELGPPGQAYDSNLDDPDAADSNLRTLTFRDAGYSPIGGPNVDPTAEVTTTVVRNEVVTLFASDGSSWSMKNMMVYTEANGRDRLSSSGVQVLNITPASTGAGAWTSAVILGNTTQVLLTDSSGLCITSPGPGDNYAQWLSPYGIVELVENAVYRVRLTMDSNGTALAAGTTPFWDFVIDNYDGATAENKYAGDFMNLDNEGGANAVGLSTTTGRGEFDIWYTPPAVLAADWNNATTGQFIASKDANNDMRFNFRVLDVTSSIDGANDAGTLCLRNVTVDRFDITQLLPVGSPLYAVTTMSATTHVVGSVFGDRTTTTYASGNITIAPNTSSSAGNDAWDVEVITLDPGNTDISTPAERVDNWPITWESDKLLMATVAVQAPNAQGETNPPDVISLVWDPPTSELLYRTEVYSGPNTNGLPKVAAPTSLVSLFYTHNTTASTADEYDRIRLRVMLLLTDSINSGNDPNNTGGITILSESVQEVSVP